MPGYVYVLTNPCIQYAYVENGSTKVISPVKIGIAKDVEKRLGILRGDTLWSCAEWRDNWLFSDISWGLSPSVKNKRRHNKWTIHH